jgi:hypothetical protein
MTANNAEKKEKEDMICNFLWLLTDRIIRLLVFYRSFVLLFGLQKTICGPYWFPAGRFLLISFINEFGTSFSCIARYLMVIAGLLWLNLLAIISNPTP